MKFGWVYQGYTWYAAYWDAVVLVRKFGILIITQLEDLSTTSALNYIALICLAALYLELLVCALLHPVHARVCAHVRKALLRKGAA